MYPLLILLVSPAFGRPSSDLLDAGKGIINQLDSVVGFNEETKAVFNNSDLFEKISASLEEAKENILQMEVELKTLESEEIQFEKEYFPEFNKAKSYLRQTRQGLRKLAYRTVADVRDLKLLLEGLDKNEDPVFLKNAIVKMKDLMIATLQTLTEAREKYNSAVETFDNLNSNIATRSRKLEKMVDTNSAEYKAMTTKLRAGTYGTIGATTVACIIADILGALGICSATTIVISTTTITAIEVEITKYRAEMEKLITITGRMMKSGNTLDQEMNEAIDLLTEEIDLIDNWANSAEVVSNNIDKYPQEYLKKYITIRTVFINGLDDLKNAADKFLAQPVDIL